MMAQLKSIVACFVRVSPFLFSLTPLFSLFFFIFFFFLWIVYRCACTHLQTINLICKLLSTRRFEDGKKKKENYYFKVINWMTKSLKLKHSHQSNRLVFVVEVDGLRVKMNRNEIYYIEWKSTIVYSIWQIICLVYLKSSRNYRFRYVYHNLLWLQHKWACAHPIVPQSIHSNNIKIISY